MSKTRITTENITDGNLTSAEFLGGLGDANQIDKNSFNIGLLGFKMAVNEGLTVFNLVDGVVDEFHSESGIDTGENSNYEAYIMSLREITDKESKPILATAQITQEDPLEHRDETSLTYGTPLFYSTRSSRSVFEIDSKFSV